MNNELVRALNNYLEVENPLNPDFNLFESNESINYNGSFSIPNLDNFLISTAIETIKSSIWIEDLIVSDSLASELDLLTGRKNLFEPLVSKESLVNLETAEKQPEDLKELYQSGAILNDLDNSKKSSEDSGDQEDLDGSESFNSLAILVTPIEQQAIDDYIATALPIGNRNYIKEGFYGNARDDLRRFFANPLGLPITSGTTPDGIMFEFVRLSDGSTITARSSSKSTGDPTMDVTYRTGLQLKVRYVGF